MADRVYLLDMVRFLTATEGTGPLSQGATPTGYLSPQLAEVAPGRLYTWKTETEDGSLWEEHEGVWTDGAPPTVARTRIIRTSTGGTTAINWQPGVRRVSCVAVSDRMVYRDTDGLIPDLRWHQIGAPQISGVPIVAFDFSLPTTYSRFRLEWQDVQGGGSALYLRAGTGGFLGGPSDYASGIAALGTSYAANSTTGSLIPVTEAMIANPADPTFGWVEFTPGGAGSRPIGHAVGSYVHTSGERRTQLTSWQVLTAGRLDRVRIAAVGANLYGAVTLSGAR